MGAGSIAVVLGGSIVVTAPGGFGNGSGLAGAIAAVVLGLIAVVTGGLVWARSRRPA